MKVTDLLYKKFDIARFQMSKHFLEDRNDRIIDILCKPGGFGVIVKVIEEDAVYKMVTSAQVAIILDKQGEKIITAYPLKEHKYRTLITA